MIMNTGSFPKMQDKMQLFKEALERRNLGMKSTLLDAGFICDEKSAKFGLWYAPPELKVVGWMFIDDAFMLLCRAVAKMEFSDHTCYVNKHGKRTTVKRLMEMLREHDEDLEVVINPASNEAQKASSIGFLELAIDFEEINRNEWKRLVITI